MSFLASSFDFCMFANPKATEMQQGENTNTIYEDANYDNVPFFDETDFEYLNWGIFLPHWHQNGKYVFVTFRLHDSLPQEKLQWIREEKEGWLKRHPQPWTEAVIKEYTDKFGKAIDKWLDNNYGDCLLKKESNRKIVEDSLLFFDGKRYDLIAFVVMPNHVHILMKLKEGYELTEIMRSIKSFTAKEINKIEKKTGPVWQSESYDRLIRDQKHLENVVRYIIANNKELAWVAPSIDADCIPQSGT